MKKYWLIMAVAIFVLSCYGLFVRVPSGAPNAVGLDKVAHFLMFLGQFYVLGRWLKATHTRQFVVLWVLALVWALASELVQGYFTARTMDVWDGVADMLGASVAVIILYLQKAQRHVKAYYTPRT